MLGTAAMFTVGGGILVHGIGPLHHAVEAAAQSAAGWPPAGLWSALLPVVVGAAVGMAAGAILAVLATVVQRLRK